jgi:ATP-dependent helicase/nuclease subunit A
MTTFSRKAAKEMRTRLEEALLQLGQGSPYEITLAAFRAERGLPPWSTAELRKRAVRARAGLLHAEIGTMHGLAARIVREQTLALGLSRVPELLDERREEELRERVILDTLEAVLAEDPSTVAHLRYFGSTLAVLDAVTSVLRARSEGQGAELVAPAADVFALERLMDQVKMHASRLTSARFAAARSRFLAAVETDENAEIAEAISELFAVAARGKKTDDEDAWFAFRDALPGTSLAERGRRFARAYVSRHILAPITTWICALATRAERRLHDEMRTQGVVGFSGLLRLSREALLTSVEAAQEVSAGIDALFLDESQDTSPLQVDLVRLLWCRPGARVHGVVPHLADLRPEGLLVVGDRKQSIYGFRGADVGLYAELAVGLAGATARRALHVAPELAWEPEHPSADLFSLRHNRRGVPALLRFANAVSRVHFRPRFSVPALYEIDYAADTEDLVVPEPEPKLDLQAPTPALAAPVVWLRVQPERATSTRLEEARVIAQQIAELVDADTVPRTPPKDIAVLALTNQMLDAMAFALAERGLPYVVAGRNFYSAREVGDAVAMLALCQDPSDRLAMLTVLRGPWGGLRDESLLALSATGRGLLPVNSWSQAPNLQLMHPDDATMVRRIQQVVLSLAPLVDRLGPSGVLERAMLDLDFEATLLSVPRGAQKLANVRKVLALASRETDGRAFVRRLQRLADRSGTETEAATFSDEDDAVRLLTVHASKGLAFPVVFLPEIASPGARAVRSPTLLRSKAQEPDTLCLRIIDPEGDGFLEAPSYAAAHEERRDRERAERQRLFYVALTRPSRALYLVGGTQPERAPAEDSLCATLGAVFASDPTLGQIIDVEVPPPGAVALADPVAAPLSQEQPPSAGPASEVTAVARAIAPTSLGDFNVCPRRFQLVHMLAFPEHVRRLPLFGEDPSGVSVDARALGTVMHRVLERVSSASFGEPNVVELADLIRAEGMEAGAKDHEHVQARVSRFLGSAYAQALRAEGAALHREVAFDLRVPTPGLGDTHLRGSIDLLVVRPDGQADIVDYKSARGPDAETYRFQLEVYRLAATQLALSAEATQVRAGVVFLGGAAAEPVFLPMPEPAVLAARVADATLRLLHARRDGHFPRVPVPVCESIHCGYLGRCHPGGGAEDYPEGSGTTPNPDGETIT